MATELASAARPINLCRPSQIAAGAEISARPQLRHLTQFARRRAGLTQLHPARTQHAPGRHSGTIRSRICAARRDQAPPPTRSARAHAAAVHREHGGDDAPSPIEGLALNGAMAGGHGSPCRAHRSSNVSDADYQRENSPPPIPSSAASANVPARTCRASALRQPLVALVRRGDSSERLQRDTPAPGFHTLFSLTASLPRAVQPIWYSIGA